LYAIDAAPELVTPLSTVDRLRPLATLTLDSTPGERVADLDLLPLIRRRAFAAMALEAVGVAQAALDLAADHVKTRQQFGRVIGTYQAVSHQIADIFTALALARSLATWAAWTVSADDENADLACAAAKAAAGDAAVAACEKAIQVHGGIGFTYEHILHRYYKRAQWIQAFEGTSRGQRAELATALLDGGLSSRDVA
jgi:alkylation response protein AidB-like acyl-CoA dehydrogenase